MAVANAVIAVENKSSNQEDPDGIEENALMNEPDSSSFQITKRVEVVTF